MKIRMFGSHDCEECYRTRKFFAEKRVSFEFIDGMADENQDLCDEHNVWDFPHVQLLNSKGVVLKQYIKDIDLPKLFNDWQVLLKKKV
jgi:arsenate reductase-like glutaredoxin family protein